MNAHDYSLIIVSNYEKSFVNHIIVFEFTTNKHTTKIQKEP